MCLYNVGHCDLILLDSDHLNMSKITIYKFIAININRFCIAVQICGIAALF